MGRFAAFIKNIFKTLANRQNIRNSDWIYITQLEAERKFFQTKPATIEKILTGTKLCVFDIGARGGIEEGLKKYYHLLDITLAEPDPEEAKLLKAKGVNVIQSIIGKEMGECVLNICQKPALSSVLEPNGEFLDFYTSGSSQRFSVAEKVSLPMTSIDCALRSINGELDYLKLDTQGSELEILKGLGSYRPIIIKTEVSFVPLYKNSAIFFHLGELLYDMGYVLFHLTYQGKNAPSKHKSGRPYDETIIPVHGNAWFMPDWTRSEGKKIIKAKGNKYEALMLMFSMADIHKYAIETIQGERH
jgi:FkbM family methyltransferase